jgi:hypothetical protein
MLRLFLTGVLQGPEESVRLAPPWQPGLAGVTLIATTAKSRRV